ncbi:AAA family ATPase [Deinococcus aestuarii]|uniref:AAA family ATPase n=1 Tax=Deinococcus aestuarii TaxID=2774531 RepID=UPI001C0AB988
MTKSQRRSGTRPVEEFYIHDLYGSRNVRIRFRESQLILVGENGRGKTTILSIFYYTITKQWHKLSNFHFSRIELKFRGRSPIVIHKERMFTDSDSEGPYDSFIHEIMNSGRYEGSTFESNVIAARDISGESGIPLTYVRDYLQRRRSTLNKSVVSDINRLIDESIDCQIVYMPTYRRIEQDIRLIFPEMSHSFSDIIQRRSPQSKNYIEFVEFGMSDVKSLLEVHSNRLGASLTEKLINLSRNYLTDIMSRNYLDITYDKNLFPMYVKMLQDMNEHVKGFVDISQIESIMSNLKSRKKLDDHEKIVMSFVSRLVDVFLQQSREAGPIYQFAELINSYFIDKFVLYNPSNYTVKFYHRKPYLPNENSMFFVSDSLVELYNKEDEIDLKDLSSGEKQIVSLFSHIYLSDRKRMFLIIDEPELSLSLPWQKKLLVDVSESGRVEGLFAVTHSPFIFDNKMDVYSHDMAEFEESNVVS